MRVCSFWIEVRRIPHSFLWWSPNSFIQAFAAPWLDSSLECTPPPQRKRCHTRCCRVNHPCQFGAAGVAIGRARNTCIIANRHERLSWVLWEILAGELRRMRYRPRFLASLCPLAGSEEEASLSKYLLVDLEAIHLAQRIRVATLPELLIDRRYLHSLAR